MRSISRLLSTALLLFSCVASAADYSENPNQNDPDIGADATAKYLKALGSYFGYDLTTNFSPIGQALLSYTLSMATNGQQLINTFFSAIPINAHYPSFSNDAGYGLFNDKANILFGEKYASPGGAAVSVTSNFDQQTWQQDPVSQAVLNLIGTPNWSVCPSQNSSSNSNSSALSCLSGDLVMTTVLQDVTNTNGDNSTLPGESDYYTYETNSKFISQLNSNNLLGPLVYSTDTQGGDNRSKTKGLPSGNQAQQAQDFIRYATEAVLPLPTMTSADYSALFKIAYYSPANANANNVMNARVGLANYLLNLRVYAAKSSIAISNFYYLLAKRMPQTVSTGNGGNTTTSEALNEFQMATWRIYNPQKSQANEQWVSQINAATPSTIQKEMAILLSEINYQLYLNRQQQERLLLTNSALLLQLLSTNKPSSEFPSDVDKDTSAPAAPEEAAND